MNLAIGGTIKALRKQRGLTQEQLGEAIGISFQAVSKWENGIALPDVTLVPALASYFGVTIDALFDFNLAQVNAKVDEICREAHLYRETDAPRARLILEQGLAQYPDNDVLLNNLLYVTVDADQSIALANKLIAQTAQDDVRFDALRFLAHAYKAKGDTAAGLAEAQRALALLEALRGEEKIERFDGYVEYFSRRCI